ncbi:MAG: PIN domain-containing protein [Acidobacteriia bacterium]|nr:PIN domain-containing protein [Terriglobia bacterium]
MTKPYLLDVNLLVALAWPSHVHHREAQQWFARKGKSGFRTCPLTQAGFVRISSNPKFSPEAVSPADAAQLLAEITGLPEHGFWPDDLTFEQAMGRIPHLAGHRQVTDAYLAALATAHGGILATLDRGAATLSSAVELVARPRG